MVIEPSIQFPVVGLMLVWVKEISAGVIAVPSTQAGILAASATTCVSIFIPLIKGTAKSVPRPTRKILSKLQLKFWKENKSTVCPSLYAISTVGILLVFKPKTK